MFFPFITGKNFTFRIIVEIIFALWLILSLRETLYRPKFSGILAAFSAYVAIIFVADLNSEYVLKSIWSNYERMEGFVTLIHLLAYFVVLGSMFIKRSTWDHFFNLMLIVASGLSTYGLFQLGGFLTINQGGIRVDGTLGNATYFAIYLVFHFFLALMLAIRQKGLEWDGLSRSIITASAVFVPLVMFGFLPQGAEAKEGREIFAWIIPIVALATVGLSFLKRQYLYLFISIFYTLVLYYTATRGAILGLIGGTLLASLLIALFEKEEKSLKRISWGIVGAVSIIVIGFFFVRNTDFVMTSPVLSRFATISLNETKTQARAYVWPMAIQGFKERPILGWGQESFNYVFNKNYNPNMFNHEPWFDRTHNVFLDWLIAGGILGLLGYLSLYVFGLYALWKKSDMAFAERAVLAGLFSAYMFHNFFVFDNLISYLLFVIFLAFLHFDTAKDFSERTSFISGPINNMSNLGLSIMSSVIVVLAVWGVYAINGKAIAANTTLIQAINGGTQSTPADRLKTFQKAINYETFGNQEIREQLIQVAFASSQSTTMSPQDKEAFYQYTKAQYEEMIKQAPNDTRHRIFFGTLLGNHGDYQAGLNQFLEAQKLSPKKQTILFEIARFHLIAGDNDGAINILKDTLALAPSNDDARISLAVAAIYAKQNEFAKQVLMEGFNTTAYSNEQLLRAYFDTKQFDQVLAIWLKRAESNPTSRNYAGVAASYVQLGRKVDARLALEKARDLELDPNIKSQYQKFIDDLVAGKNILQ